jgi:hypothetical protein
MRSGQGFTMRFGRHPPPPEPPLDRGDVLAIIGALADVYTDTQTILRILEEEDDGTEPWDEP